MSESSNPERSVLDASGLETPGPFPRTVLAEQTWPDGRSPEASGVPAPGPETQRHGFVDGRLVVPRRIAAYRLEEPLGEGGFGQVFEALDTTLERQVAVKVVPLRSAEAGRRQELLDEAKTLARLEHPNIVPVYAAGLEPDFMWMALKKVDGMDLERHLRRHGPLGPEAAKDIFRDMLNALEHAHALGVLHRDLKPHNILIQSCADGSLRAWLTDFGIAAAFLDPSSHRKLAGTPGYMAPEDMRRRSVGPPADLFALGCVLVKAITGRHPFDGPDAESIRDAVLYEEPHNLEDVARTMGRRFADLAAYLLEKEPVDRCPSAAVALQHLNRLEVPRPATAPSRRFRLASWLGRAVRPSWDRRWMVEVDDLHQSYQVAPQVLHGASLKVAPGSVVGLVGRNGCGKTTLLRSIAGLLRSPQDAVRVFGLDPWRDRLGVLPRLGYVPEAGHLPSDVTVHRLLQHLAATHKRWDRGFTYRLLEQFALPLEQRIGDLSRGGRTQLHLVAALGFRPELLLLDDPTLGLDAGTFDELFQVLQRLVEEGNTTLVIASHNHTEFEPLYTHVALLDDGRTVFSEALEALRSRIRRVHLTFDAAPPILDSAVNFRPESSIGQEVAGVVEGVGSEALRYLKAFHPASVRVENMPLRDILVYLGQSQRHGTPSREPFATPRETRA